jgi:hypothetical protein
MDQGQLTDIFCARPQNFAWFLGAGASRTSGLPTATDILWDLKRQYYCREENQDISRQDIQNDAVKARIQSFMDARGFPALWADDEYTAYFEKIFGEDRERQRKYLKAKLAEEGVSLSVGNRVLGALMVAGLFRVTFTTNFDSVVEKAVAEMGGQSLSAYHLEGKHAANNALNNEEYPLYCKLHGDFRYDSLKNLAEDLARGNDELSACLVNAGNRFGFIVAGYSGRDESIMKLFDRVLESPNPFPHGLFWTGIKDSLVHPAVNELLDQARKKGVKAQYVEIDTFDTLMLRLWRNIEEKPAELDDKVRKSRLASVNIALPPSGRGKPLLRLNALPLLSAPNQCLSLSFKKHKEWADLRQASRDSQNSLILTKSESVWCWGTEERARAVFGSDLVSIAVRNVPRDIRSAENLHAKGFIEEALCLALARDKPLPRIRRSSAYLIVDPHAEDASGLDPLFQVVGKTSGIIPGLLSPETPDHPQAEQVRWSEALRVSIEMKSARFWVLLDPDIWVWPPRAREVATEFLGRRRADRLNQKYNALLAAWVRIVLGTDTRNTEVTLSALRGESIFPHRQPYRLYKEAYVMSSDAGDLCGYSTIPEPDLVFAGNRTGKHPLVGLINHGPYGLKFGAPAVLRFALLGPSSDVETCAAGTRAEGARQATRCT